MRLARTSHSLALIRNTGSVGTFEFEAVAEGQWEISSQVDQGGLKLWSAQPARLIARDLENVELRPAAPFAIQGKILVEVPEGALGPKPPRITLAFNTGLAGNPPEIFPAATPDAKGDFQIRNIYSGRYRILPGPAPPGYYLDTIRIGGDALESGVEFTSGAQPLTVVYKRGGGTVRGRVENCAAGTVGLLPHDKAMWRPGFVFFAPCDSNDRYELTAVRPGEYSSIAIAGDSPSPWYATMSNAEGLVNNAATVTVRTGENSSADLRAIRQ